MAKHPLTFATVQHAKDSLGESTFAKARTAIEAHYGVKPDEVFLDTIQVEGAIAAGDLSLDLGALELRYLVFGADRPAEAPVAAYPDEVAVVDSISTTTTTVS